MKFLFYAALLLCLGTRAASQSRPLTLVYPAFDQGRCALMLPLPAQYQPYLGVAAANGVVRVGRQHLRAPDSLYVVALPASDSLASFFVTTEPLQPAKTPTPADLASAVVRQHRYHQTPIEDVAIQPLALASGLSISRLSFRLGGQYMVNYLLFVNDKSVTIGTAHGTRRGASRFDSLVRELRLTCP